MTAPLETLESRRLLSATSIGFGDDEPVTLTLVTTAVTSRGTLVVKGMAINDVIAIRKAGDQYHIDATFGIAVDVPAKQVKRILVETIEGDDRVGIAPSVKVPVTIAGGAGNDTLTGQLGDTLIGG